MEDKKLDPEEEHKRSLLCYVDSKSKKPEESLPKKKAKKK